jgi:hypothetical protein
MDPASDPASDDDPPSSGAVPGFELQLGSTRRQTVAMATAKQGAESRVGIGYWCLGLRGKMVETVRTSRLVCLEARVISS